MALARLAPRSTGTIALVAGNATVQGTGTDWLTEPRVQAGDILHAQGFSVPIASVTDADTLVLAVTWPGTTASGVAYTISLLPTNHAVTTELYNKITDINEQLTGDLAGWRHQVASNVGNDYTVTLPGITELRDGTIVAWEPAETNTSTARLRRSTSLPYKTVYKNTGEAAGAGDLNESSIVFTAYLSSIDAEVIVGGQGVRGPAGQTFLRGTSAPSDGLGVDGDAYLRFDGSNNVLTIQFKSGSTWGATYDFAANAQAQAALAATNAATATTQAGIATTQAGIATTKAAEAVATQAATVAAATAAASAYNTSAAASATAAATSASAAAGDAYTAFVYRAQTEAFAASASASAASAQTIIALLNNSADDGDITTGVGTEYVDEGEVS